MMAGRYTQCYSTCQLVIGVVGDCVHQMFLISTVCYRLLVYSFPLLAMLTALQPNAICHFSGNLRSFYTFLVT